MFQVLKAERLLMGRFNCRPAPTPPGLSESICGMCIEVLDHLEKETLLEVLAQSNLSPKGIHVLDD
jgi:hypothetical protein